MPASPRSPKVRPGDVVLLADRGLPSDEETPAVAVVVKVHDDGDGGVNVEVFELTSPTRVLDESLVKRVEPWSK